VVDRIAAIRELKQVATNATQTIKTGPDDQVHRNGTSCKSNCHDVKGRALILFNITGDGTVQTLYPVGLDSPIITSSEYSFRR